MTTDRSFVDLNRAATDRLRALAERLTEAELQHPVGSDWTVAIVFAHLAFMDGRALWVLNATEREGQVVNPECDIFVNDLSLPFWAAIPPRAATRLAIAAAAAVDRRLESYPPPLLELVHAEYKRYIFRAFHRGVHLDEVEAAIKNT